MTAEQQVRVAIIGQGRSGKVIHAETLNRLKDKYAIVAVVDPLEDRRRKASEAYGCETYSDYQELFGRTDLDLVVNASPSHLHVPVTLDLLQNGFHVLCEKPLARSVQEVDRLIETAERTGRRLYVFQQSRFAPAFKQLRKVIDSGVIGRVVQVSIAYNHFARRWDWQTSRKFNGGNLLNTGPHPVDQALQLFGTDVMPNVTCIMDRANTYGDAEDYVKLILHGKNRPVIDVEISSCCAYPSFTYHVQGTRGGIKGSLTRLDWKYYKPEEAEPREWTGTPLSDANGEPVYCREQLKWYEDHWDYPDEFGLGPFNEMCKEFYEVLYGTITKGEPLGITLQHVRQQIAVMEEAHRQNPHLADSPMIG